MMPFPVAPRGAMMAISFQSDEEVLRNLRERLRRMSDAGLVRFGKEVRRLAENPFQRQLEEARAEWKRRKSGSGLTRIQSCGAWCCVHSSLDGSEDRLRRHRYFNTIALMSFKFSRIRPY
jgi:hypothetical protein